MPAQTITHTLEALNSKRDIYGNCYWAFRLTDHQTGQTVQATASGGESNIYGIARHWNVPGDWDRGVQFQTREMPIREFNRLTKSWPYAGCLPEELAKWCRTELAIMSGEETAKAARRYHKEMADRCDKLMKEYGYGGDPNDSGPLSTLLCNQK